MATKFIRVRGRVVPISDKSGATQGSKRKYAPVKRSPKLIAGAAAVGAAVGALSNATKPRFAGAIIGGLFGAALAGSVVFTKKAKGESEKHMLMRIDRMENHKRYSRTKKSGSSV